MSEQQSGGSEKYLEKARFTRRIILSQMRNVVSNEGSPHITPLANRAGRVKLLELGLRTFPGDVPFRQVLLLELFKETRLEQLDFDALVYYDDAATPPEAPESA